MRKVGAKATALPHAPTSRSTDFVASAIVQQEAMFRAAIAAWRLQQPDVLRAWLSQLLRLNPQHVEGTALLHLYEAQVWRGECIGQKL